LIANEHALAQQAAFALQELGAETVIEELLPLLAATAPATRCAAARAMLRVRDPRVDAALRAASDAERDADIKAVLLTVREQRLGGR
jgi:HEAT repeat protein